MIAILPVNEKEKIRMMKFDTDKSKKVCDYKNVNGVTTTIIYITENGRLFGFDTVENKIKYSPDYEEKLKKYIGETYPDSFEKIYGKAEDA